MLEEFSPRSGRQHWIRNRYRPLRGLTFLIIIGPRVPLAKLRSTLGYILLPACAGNGPDSPFRFRKSGWMGVIGRFEERSAANQPVVVREREELTPPCC